jgi:hypothetical protein
MFLNHLLYQEIQGVLSSNNGVSKLALNFEAE